MSKKQRLQVLFDDKEYKSLKHAAKGAGVSVGEWVRSRLRASLRECPGHPPEERLERWRRSASRPASPAADVDEMLADIEKGRFPK